ncbi:MAG: HRDC domain-containing protein [Pirellulales bacterium]|nr:HRDC domain-containing protein [Pirellulales bacterium]
MQYRNITNDEQLREYCRELAARPRAAFDTEFVSEHTFRPVLCLIQVAAEGDLAVIDPLTIEDLTPFWNTLAAEGRTTIVHSGRSEVEFSMHAIGRPPAGLFDVQIAAGLIGVEYPAGYGNLLSKVLGLKVKKHETRTDWRRRPLSKKQIEYALLDALHLEPLYETLAKRLVELGRLAWMEEEMAAWKADLEKALSHERWRKVSGNSGLDARALAVLRELYQWREHEAHRRNQPARRVLRDDLLVELAKRGTADPKQIQAVRGMERGDLARRVDALAACIRKALELPEQECPKNVPLDQLPQLSVLGQFLFAALGSLCRESQLAPALVGTPSDIRELIAQRTHQVKSKKTPRLAKGWRAHFVGKLFDELLEGKIAVRVTDPAEESPLSFEKTNAKGEGNRGKGEGGRGKAEGGSPARG